MELCGAVLTLTLMQGAASCERGPNVAASSPPSQPPPSHPPLPSEKANATCEPGDRVAALRVLMSDARLVRYFHLEQPERSGVQVIDTTDSLGRPVAGAIAPEISVAMPGAPIAPRHIALFLDGSDCGDRSIRFALRIPDEGVRATASLARSGEPSGWTLDQLDIAER